MSDQCDVVQELVQHGANINAKKEDGFTPLMVACLNNSKSTVQFLLQKKAQINCKNGSGLTALMLARAKGYNDIVRLLLGNGASIDETNFVNPGALTLASQDNVFQSGNDTNDTEPNLLSMLLLARVLSQLNARSDSDE